MWAFPYDVSSMAEGNTSFIFFPEVFCIFKMKLFMSIPSAIG